MKIAFICKPDEAQFIPSVIEHVSKKHETKQAFTYDYKEIIPIAQWADVLWLEWADPLSTGITQSALVNEKKVILRVHSYESVCGYVLNINWKAVDHVIFIAKYIGEVTFRQLIEKKIEVNPEMRIWHIPNGMEADKFLYIERNLSTYNMAWVGYIFPKKGPMLMIHAMKALVERDSRYKLFIAGRFNDMRDALYVDHMIHEMNLKDNIIFTGYQANIADWYKDKSFITCFSEFESQNLSLMEGMLTGMAPIIHNFPGAKGIYPEKYIWTTIDEFQHMVQCSSPSVEYRDFVVDHYSYLDMMERIDRVLEEIEVDVDDRARS